MTRDEAREFIPLLQAYADGKIIQHLEINGQWANCNTPNFNWPPTKYRVKPEPKKVTIAYEIHDQIRVGIHVKRDDWAYPSSWKFVEVELPE